MKIIVADKISERGIELLRETGWEIVLPTAAALPSEIANADGLIVRSATKVTSALLDRAEKLRVVGRAGVGVDNVDMDAATHRGVLVMNTPGGNAVSVAEHTFALLLALARGVAQANAAIQAGRWEKSSSGVELRGKTLGLVGLGRVGSEVARRARALEMKVLAYDPYVTPAAARELEVELIPFEDLLRRSDVVSLHTALSAATEKIINAAALAQMKKGARLINCARGELIDEVALAEALRSGHLSGAAVDTFAQEPPKNSPLIGLPNLIATPHIAGSTAEAQEEVGTLIAQQVREYLAEGLIRNAVNMPALSRGAIPAFAAVSGTGRAAGRVCGAGGGFGKFQPDTHTLRGRAGRAGFARDTQRGADRHTEFGARRKSESGERVAGGRGARADCGRDHAAARTRISEHVGSGGGKWRAHVDGGRHGGAGRVAANSAAGRNRTGSAAGGHAAADAQS